MVDWTSGMPDGHTYKQWDSSKRAFINHWGFYPAIVEGRVIKVGEAA
jgi:hypothetical protein